MIYSSSAGTSSISPQHLRSSSPCSPSLFISFFFYFAFLPSALFIRKHHSTRCPVSAFCFSRDSTSPPFPVSFSSPLLPILFTSHIFLHISRALGLSFPFLKINGQSDRPYIPEMKLLQVRGLFLLERYLAIYISCVVGDYAKCICDVMSFRRHLVPGELQFQSCNGAWIKKLANEQR